MVSRRGAMLFIISLAFLLHQGSSALKAQEVRALAKVDSNHILIGDWFRLNIEIQHPASVTVKFPSIPDSIEGFQVIKREPVSLKSSDKFVLETSTFTLTSFDSGMHIIPPLDVYYISNGDTARNLVQTSPIPIVVRGVAVDTSKEIKDVKPPLSVPLTFADIFPYALGAIVAGGLVWLYVYIRNKRKKGEPLLPSEPPRPAHEVALEKLRALESEKMWQRGKLKEYHSELTDILRTYLEKRYSIMAMEMISDEILSALGAGVIAKDPLGKLREILLRADLVKFAKFQPLPEENDKSLAMAYEFVESTWRKEAEPRKEPVTTEVSV